jgi:hypothetical protein
MTLATDEFIRRFLIHVLPKGFHRIRHYGLLASVRKAPAQYRKSVIRLSAPWARVIAPGCAASTPQKKPAGGKLADR